MLACIAFSCPNLKSLEICTSDISINRITGFSILWPTKIIQRGEEADVIFYLVLGRRSNVLPDHKVTLNLQECYARHPQRSARP